MNKVCKKCKESKDTEYFYKLTKSRDGFQTWCKPCMDDAFKRKSAERLANGPSIIRDAKVCRDCNTRKPINQFFVKRGYSADGYGSYCKPCWIKRTVISQKKAKQRNQ